MTFIQNYLLPLCLLFSSPKLLASNLCESTVSGVAIKKYIYADDLITNSDNYTDVEVDNLDVLIHEIQLLSEAIFLESNKHSVETILVALPSMLSAEIVNNRYTGILTLYKGRDSDNNKALTVYKDLSSKSPEEIPVKYEVNTLISNFFSKMARLSSGVRKIRVWTYSGDVGDTLTTVGYETSNEHFGGGN